MLGHARRSREPGGEADMDLKLSGKRVLVPGRNSGLGAAMARAFATEHARVAINYVVHPEQTEQLASQLRALAIARLRLEMPGQHRVQVARLYHFS
jgi:NAD(P)-dependent dehydrogenase (short-subunit alcohol dehydrogenase family)